MQKLKYNYKNIELNKYNELLTFLENIAEFAIFQKMILRGNQEAIPFFEDTKNKIIKLLKTLDYHEYFYKEKKSIINLITENRLNESEYGNLIHVVLNLKEVYRYSSIPTQLPENVLFHQYTVTIISLIMAEYCNQELEEEIYLHKRTFSRMQSSIFL